MLNSEKNIGPINSIVLSRAGESDNVYLRDETSVKENGLCEIKISENQIMNWQDRSDYLQGLLNALSGFNYYINDFSSTGILYYDVGDVYSVQVGETTYNCIMLNDEINVTQGIEEIIHTDMPEQKETDYEKADKTDRKINQAYIIVDKQNHTIESVVNTITTQNDKISRITQTVDELNSKISDIADITINGESTQGLVELNNINQSEPITINIHPIVTNISYLYPRGNLYPSNNLLMQDRKIRFVRTYNEDGETKTENIDYTLPDDLLYYDSDNYDEFILNYDSQTCQIRKKCQYNADGTVSLLENEIVADYLYPQILLGDGDYKIELLGYNVGYLSVRLMAQNIYTTQFATKAELNSEISQTVSEINLSVDKKLTSYPTTTQMNSAISITANEINSQVSKKVGDNEIISKINQSAEQITIDASRININGTVSANGNFKVDKNGNMECTNAKINVQGGENTGSSTGLNLKVTNPNDNYNYSGLAPDFFIVRNGQSHYINAETGKLSTGIQVMRNKDYYISIYAEDDYSFINLHGSGGYSTSIKNTGITTPVLTQLSLESIKKNFEEVEDATSIVKNSEIYKYNLKTEEDTDKKHYGFVIGENYNTPDEVISKTGDGIDTYSMCSILWKAVQEQQEQLELNKEQIKLLQEEINKLKGENNG